LHKKHSKGLTLVRSHEIIYLTRKHKHTIKFEGIQTKSSSGAPNEDDGRKIAKVIISFLPHLSVWQFSAVCISWKTHSRTIYYVFCPTSVWLIITRG